VKRLQGSQASKPTPRPAHPRVGLTKDLIIRAALSLIDDAGLDGLTIRALSSRLGVQTRTIYWHAGPRNAILAATVELVSTGIIPPPTRSWEDWMRTLFRNFRRAISKHPNIAALIGAQMVPSVTADFNLVEQILSNLNRAGYEGDRLVGAFSAVIGTMTGLVTLEFAPLPAEEAEEWSNNMQAKIAAIDESSYPILYRMRSKMINRALVVRWKRGTEAPLDLGFDTLTEIFIAGLASHARK
jgi:AcrR family transcriptional regulator